MRTILVCLAFSILHSQFSTLSAQHYIGLKGGYGGAQGRFYPKYQSSMVWGKFTGGIVWKYYSPQQVVGGVSVELEYQQRGYRAFSDGIVSDTTNYVSRSRTVNSITLPLIWQPHIYFAKQRIRLFVNAGFTLTYNLGIGETTTYFTHKYNKSTGVETTTNTTTKYTMIPARDHRINYGICFGGGLGFLFGRCEIALEARYYYGMSDILRTKTRYIFNDLGVGTEITTNSGTITPETPTIRSELDNLYVSVGIYFRLGKGGIKEPPLSLKRRAVPIGDGDFRNIKLDNMRY